MLAALLQRQIAELTELLALLRKEQDQLVAHRDADDTLEPLVAKKATIIATLEILESERKSLLTELGYAHDQVGSLAAAQAEGCLDQWLSIQDLGRQTAHHNEVNGSLIQLRITHNSRLLEKLREIASERLYDAHGQPLKRSGRIETSA